MANFKSWKSYMLFLIDRVVEEQRCEAPFLDAGCGAGDVSMHFASRGWVGTAVDFSETVVEGARKRLSAFPGVRVLQSDLAGLSIEPVKTILLMDVLEHVKEDGALLKSLHQNLAPGGQLIATVPVDPREWRWDDAFYGHYRRYPREKLRALFEECGFEVGCEWDCSFPLFWLMRRVYTRLIRKDEFSHLTPEERTKISTCQSAWDYSFLSTILDRFLSLTRLAYLQFPFRRAPWGCEALWLLRKRETSASLKAPAPA